MICILYMLVNVSYVGSHRHLPDRTQMIVVSKEQQLASTDVALAFLNNVIGHKHASAILAIFTTINSFGNVIGMTFTLARAK